MNYVKKLNLHWFCTQNHIFEPFSVRRACTKSYVTSEPYPRASQIWCQNVRETWKKKVIKCRGESFPRCRVIARYVEGGGLKGPPPSLFRVKPSVERRGSPEVQIIRLQMMVLPREWIEMPSGNRYDTLSGDADTGFTPLDMLEVSSSMV